MSADFVDRVLAGTQPPVVRPMVPSIFEPEMEFAPTAPPFEPDPATVPPSSGAQPSASKPTPADVAREVTARPPAGQPTPTPAPLDQPTATPPHPGEPEPAKPVVAVTPAQADDSDSATTPVSSAPAPVTQPQLGAATPTPPHPAEPPTAGHPVSAVGSPADYPAAAIAQLPTHTAKTATRRDSVTGRPQQQPPDDRTVHITIGRVEVRAAPPATPAPAANRPTPKREPVLSLADYLGARPVRGAR